MLAPLAPLLDQAQEAMIQTGWAMPTDIALITILVIVGFLVVVQDYRLLCVRKIDLAGFVLVCLALALLFPAPGLDLPGTVFGLLVAARTLGIVALALRLPFGHGALGGVDIYLGAGFGLLLGPAASAVWILAFSALRTIGWRLAPRLAGERHLARGRSGGNAAPGSGHRSLRWPCQRDAALPGHDDDRACPLCRREGRTGRRHRSDRTHSIATLAHLP